MADFEAPSFSLGLDFDLLDSEPQIATATELNKAPTTSNHFSVAGTILEDNDEDFETLTVVDSDSENRGSSPKLKRLRRGSTVKEDLQSSEVVVDDDDIDDFSSQEDEHLSTHRHSVCNSSKFPLNGHGVLTKQGKRKQNILNDPESVMTSCNKPPFTKLTVSPLRRFQLIDSDSDFDDPFICDAATNKTCNGSESNLNRGPPDSVQHVGLNQQRKLNELVNTTTRKDLWEDFRVEKSFRIPTPAFDEVCEEYFSSMKDKSKSQSNIGKNNQNIHVTSSVIDLGDPRPPAHQYFFHIDPRVQDLVRTLLPNFFPLNAANRDSEQPSTSNIDYMLQSDLQGCNRAAVLQSETHITKLLNLNYMYCLLIQYLIMDGPSPTTPSSHASINPTNTNTMSSDASNCSNRDMAWEWGECRDSMKKQCVCQRLVDTEEKPSMGYIYDAVDRAKEQIKKNVTDERLITKLWGMIQTRWFDQLHHPLHAAGYYLNPAIFHGENSKEIKKNRNIVTGLYVAIDRLVPDDDENDKVRQDLNLYIDSVGQLDLQLL
ncbi:hypothetical protein L1987_02405 [Smallanthus sonchifolius]|uniref:Uncharacterized protein n=1 Tax=Smallanthus sonchifolius TaxID=185202 RepID=A0ACB9K7X2_9ASTR|nr:hypothetical protein L1987_02405 [Smallanthus sonchifolius]